MDHICAGFRLWRHVTMSMVKLVGEQRYDKNNRKTRPDVSGLLERCGSLSCQLSGNAQKKSCLRRAALRFGHSRSKLNNSEA